MVKYFCLFTIFPSRQISSKEFLDDTLSTVNHCETIYSSFQTQNSLSADMKNIMLNHIRTLFNVLRNAFFRKTDMFDPKIVNL